jgi:type II secretion system protein N
MKRALIFLALFAVFVVLTFPHELILRRVLVEPLASAGIAVELDSAGFALPLGYRATGLKLELPQASVDVDSLYVGILRSLHASACGGTIDAQVSSGPSLSLSLVDVDPGTCLHIGELILSGTLRGDVELQDIPMGSDDGGLPRAGHIVLDATNGTFGGLLPAEPGRPAVALGEWSFESASIEAEITDGQLALVRGAAVAQGLELASTGGTIGPAKGARIPIAIDFKARTTDDSARAKAVLGMLPKATQKKDGWRQYRIKGTLQSPELIGLK